MCVLRTWTRRWLNSYHLMKDRKITIYGTVAVFIFGNMQVMKYPHTVSTNSVKNLLEDTSRLYPSVKVIVTGVLPRPDLETWLTPYVKNVNHVISKKCDELVKFHQLKVDISGEVQVF